MTNAVKDNGTAVFNPTYGQDYPGSRGVHDSRHINASLNQEGELYDTYPSQQLEETENSQDNSVQDENDFMQPEDGQRKITATNGDYENVKFKGESQA